jgi:hypothetical protein
MTARDNIEVNPDYRLPVGDLTPGANPTIPMPRPKQVDAWKGAPEIRAPGGSTQVSDNPPAEAGINSPGSLGVPQSKPVWQGSPDGPVSPPNRTGHPALR